MSEEKEEIVHNTGLSLEIINDKIDRTIKKVTKILSAFLRGNHLDAIQITRALLKSMRFEKLTPGVALYKSRDNERLYLYSRDEMFHIPYDKRNLVGNQRFSLSGLPCLYLGGSSYICWEELGRKDLNSSNYCGYALRHEVNMFDLLLPTEITNPHQIRRVCLALSCSLAANRDHLFKPEYILPQCILHALIFRSFYNHSLFCVRYYSSHLLNDDADFFKCDYSKEEDLARYVNYVFPAASSGEKGYSEELRSLFTQTETISLMRETILSPGHLVSACNNDTYLDSQFGLIDAVLDEKMGFEPRRKEGDVLLVRKEK